MKSQLIDAADGSRTYALVFADGDEVVSQLSAFAEYEGLTGASFKGIGAFRDVVLGYSTGSGRRTSRSRSTSRSRCCRSSETWRRRTASRRSMLMSSSASATRALTAAT